MNFHENAPRQFPPNAALDLQALPYESIVSSLWRFAWRNGLSAKELLKFCSTGKSYAKEVGAKCPARGFDPEVFYEASCWIDQSRETEFVEAGREKSRGVWWSRALRYCPVCLEHLYHSYWHQSEFLSYCPIDGAELRTDCYCCGAALPAYGFHHTVLNMPYTCAKCQEPISGIKLSLASRLAMQQRGAELKRILGGVEQWWLESASARQQIESLLPSESPQYYAPWLRTERSMRQWAIALAPPPDSLPVPTMTVPRLVVLKWQVRLKPDDSFAVVVRRRKSKFENLRIARQVYRATLRRLIRAISRCAPFDETQYRRHQAVPVDDFLKNPKQCNMMLLALILFRESYETYFSAMGAPPDKAMFQEWNVGFPDGNDFAERVRICWRAQFIAEYAAFYWWLMARRDGRRGVKEFRRENAALSNVDVNYDSENGDFVSGRVAFPTIEGLNLGLFP